MTNFTNFEKQGILPGFTHDDWDELLYSGLVVQKPDETYIMAYTGYQSDGLQYGPCIVTSENFVTWDKPNLGQISYGGNTNNNIIILHDAVGVQDLVYLDDVYVLLVRNDDSATNLIYTSADGLTNWTFLKTAFSNTSHGEHVEAKCVLRVNGNYRIYYSQGHSSPGRRSLGYYEAPTLDGTYVDQGLVPEFTSTDEDIQFYDIKTWEYQDSIFACVPKFNATTDILGPLQTFESGNDGNSWEYVGNIIENGAPGAFDDNLVAAAKPILVDDTWHMIYVGGDNLHEVWPKPMEFADSTEIPMATTEDTRLNRPVTDTITDDDYLVIIDNPADSAQTLYATASTLKTYTGTVVPTSLSASVANGPAILDETASTTNPTICPNKTTTNSGLGWSSGGNIWVIANGGSNALFENAGTLAATETCLWIYDNDGASLKQVTVGADDSGGAGFKVLRIAN